MLYCQNNSMAMKLIPARRGRPQKFGRPARAVTLTLPEDVIAALSGHRRRPEPRRGASCRSRSWRMSSRVRWPSSPSTATAPSSSSSRSPALGRIPGVTLVPLPDGRALISLDESMTVVRVRAEAARPRRHRQGARRSRARRAQDHRRHPAFGTANQGPHGPPAEHHRVAVQQTSPDCRPASCPSSFGSSRSRPAAARARRRSRRRQRRRWCRR